MARLFLWSVKGVDAMVWGGLMRDRLGARGRVSGGDALEPMVVRWYGMLAYYLVKACILKWSAVEKLSFR